MSFLNPIAFWGLLSLLIPLIIHLLSKKQKHVIYFGSNRFLSDEETTSASSIQLSDYSLLALRLLMLASLICAIAQMVKTNDKTKRIKYIEHGLVVNQDYASAIPQIDSKELIKYFSYDATVKKNNVDIFPSAYTLINHLNQKTDSISVYTFSEDKYFLGSKETLHQTIEWNIIPKKESAITEGIEDQAVDFDIVCSSKSLRHKNDFVSVMTSIQEYLPFEVNYKESNEWKILIDSTSNDSAENTIYWTTQNPPFSFAKHFDGYSMTGSLNKKAMLESNFPLALTQALIKSRTHSNEQEFKVLDPRHIDGATTSEVLKAEAPDNFLSYTNYFWLLLALLILTERYVSLHKIQE